MLQSQSRCFWNANTCCSSMRPHATEKPRGPRCPSDPRLALAERHKQRVYRGYSIETLIYRDKIGCHRWWGGGAVRPVAVEQMFQNLTLWLWLYLSGYWATAFLSIRAGWRGGYHGDRHQGDSSSGRCWERPLSGGATEGSGVCMSPCVPCLCPSAFSPQPVPFSHPPSGPGRASFHCFMWSPYQQTATPDLVHLLYIYSAGVLSKAT